MLLAEYVPLLFLFFALILIGHYQILGRIKSGGEKFHITEKLDTKADVDIISMPIVDEFGIQITKAHLEKNKTPNSGDPLAVLGKTEIT